MKTRNMTIGELVEKNGAALGHYLTSNEYDNVIIEQVAQVYDNTFEIKPQSLYYGAGDFVYFGKKFPCTFRYHLEKQARFVLNKINSYNKAQFKKAKFVHDIKPKCLRLEDIISPHDDIVFLKKMLHAMKLSYYVYRGKYLADVKPHAWQKDCEQQLLMLTLKGDSNEKNISI